MSVNVSAHQLMSRQVRGKRAEGARQHFDPAALLTVEVTESVLVGDRERALVVLEELKGIGVGLALDRFGTGYASLGYLKTLPIDTIKIDTSFIAKLSHDPSNHAIVTAIIGLAHALGFSVVSAGVENARQHQDVQRNGV